MSAHDHAYNLAEGAPIGARSRNGQYPAKDGGGRGDATLQSARIRVLDEIEAGQIVRIAIDGNLKAMSCEAVEALKRSRRVFVRSGALVRVVEDEHGAATVQTVAESALRGILVRCAEFYAVRIKDKQPVEVAAPPPMEVVRDVLTLGEWPFQPLEGVIESPAMRRDGSVIETPGYDPATRLFYHPREGFKMPAIPTQPSEAQVKEALALLRDTFKDFPFDGPASADNALALLFSIPTRAMYDIAPIAAIDAPQQGTGKTKLAAATVLLSTGSMPTIGTAPDDPDEWRKRITAQLAAGKGVVVFDNVTRSLENDALASVTTSQVWEDRALGSNQLLKLPVRAVWIATGNNIRVGADMASRCYLIRLDAQMSNPQERTGFAHADLEGHITARRPELLAAVLTICRAWVLAGKPAPTKCPQMRHPQWRAVVGGILEHAGASMLGNQHEFYESADDEGPAWEAFIAKVAALNMGEITTGALFDRAIADASLADVVPDRFAMHLTETGRAKFSQSMGYALRERKGKRFGATQARVTCVTTKKNGTRWSFTTNGGEA
jgi:hypothetical protein